MYLATVRADATLNGESTVKSFAEFTGNCIDPEMAVIASMSNAQATALYA